MAFPWFIINPCRLLAGFVKSQNIAVYITVLTFSLLSQLIIYVAYISSEFSMSSLTLTCDQASFYFRGGKVRLIQLLDYLSVASPESRLFSDWSRNKRYLELSH